MDEQDRLALEYFSGELATGQARIYEHIAGTFRWLMATLFAANGGGIIALLGKGEGLPGSHYALAWFAVGIILSLLMGALSAYFAHKASYPIAELRGKIHQALVAGEIKETAAAVQNWVAQQQMNWKKWSPTYAGLASLACFVAGIATITGSILF